MTAAETRAHTCVHEAPAFRAEVAIPPSVNALYRNVPGRGRVATRAYRDWRDSAEWECLMGVGKPVSGPYRFTLHLPAKMRGDCDGRIKAPLDMLVRLCITPDDRHAVSVHAERSADVPAGRCIITVEAA